MGNTIAVIWDCDRTLIDGYMQDPLFEEYGVDPAEFWAKVNAVPSRYPGVRFNRDTYYLNFFIKCAHDGTFPGLSTQKLFELGKKQRFYPGMPDFLGKLRGMFSDRQDCAEYGIHVENYIVSTGFAQTVRGSELMTYADGVWGCELIDAPGSDGRPVISEVVYTIDNTTKTRAIFEINKGIGKIEGIDVNTQIPADLRRVRFENMIYIADGPSDIPAFSLVKQRGGYTFAVYPRGDMAAMRQVEQMRSSGRVEMFAEADYSEGTTANMWITNKVTEIAGRIIEAEKRRVKASASDAPKHLV